MSITSQNAKTPTQFHRPPTAYHRHALSSQQVAADQLPKLAQLRDRLMERLAGVRGAAVEDNVFSVSVHYRNCDPGDVQAVSW